MKNKAELVNDLHEAFLAGVITEADLQSFLSVQPQPVVVQPVLEQQIEPVTHKDNRLSAVDVIFYIAGIVLFAAIVSVIVQSWNDGNAVSHIALSAGIGSVLWAIVYYLIRKSPQSEIRQGLINSMLVTGSLLIITGSYIIVNQMTNGFNSLGLIPGAIMLAVIGGVHIAYDRLVKKDFVLLLGILLSVAAFPTLIFGFLQNAQPPPDVYAVIEIAAAGLLTYATRVVAKINPGRNGIRIAFDGVAAFLILGTMYASSFDNYGVIWLILLIASVFGIFYLSITMQNKNLLGSGSFFLVLTVVTISFKYFSGYGVTTSLIIATIGLLGSAFTAASINKKYFKRPLGSDHSLSL